MNSSNFLITLFINVTLSWLVEVCYGIIYTTDVGRVHDCPPWGSNDRGVFWSEKKKERKEKDRKKNRKLHCISLKPFLKNRQTNNARTAKIQLAELIKKTIFLNCIHLIIELSYHNCITQQRRITCNILNLYLKNF